jgi:hypothetical protein
MCGWWADDVGGSGLFTLEKSDQPADKGDPVSYPKDTKLIITIMIVTNTGSSCRAGGGRVRGKGL